MHQKQPEDKRYYLKKLLMVTSLQSELVLNLNPTSQLPQKGCLHDVKIIYKQSFSENIPFIIMVYISRLVILQACYFVLKVGLICPKYIAKLRAVDTIQDFLCKLGMKPHMHLVEISIFSLNHVITRPTKIIKDVCKASTQVVFMYWLYRGP